jgi:hypothetical protein
MRTSFKVAVALIVLAFGSGAVLADTKLTEQQVKTVCGSKLTTGKAGKITAFGCEAKCGLNKEKICSYSCSDKDKQGTMTCFGTTF